eukprot:3698909-Pyramimonas_sp.AAC.1
MILSYQRSASVAAMLGAVFSIVTLRAQPDKRGGDTSSHRTLYPRLDACRLPAGPKHLQERLF